jgi:two-component system, NarL family, nitrate/nitrite response regulator NarL
MSHTTTKHIRLLLVDDHALFREGLAGLLSNRPDMSVVGKCATAREALEQIQQSQPTMILLDFDLRGERADNFVSAAREKGFAGKVLVVTAGVSEMEAVQLVQSGVAGILHKYHPPDVLVDTIRKVAEDEVCLEKSYLKPLFRSLRRCHAEGDPELTERDKTILRYVFQGLSNKEIGTHLQLTEGAVKASLRQLFQKLEVHTRAQLVKIALEQYKDQF